MLNDKGGIECDLTVARTAHDEFYIVTGTGFATHDFDWIRRNIPAGMNAQLFDVTSANAVLRSEEHTSELQSLMRISYAVFCLKKTTPPKDQETTHRSAMTSTK